MKSGSELDEGSEANSDEILNNSGLNLLKSLKRGAPGSMDDRHLTMREKTLMKRRKEAERLLQWKRKLDEEEKKVHDMERQAISAWGGEKIPPDVETSSPETISKNKNKTETDDVIKD